MSNFENKELIQAKQLMEEGKVQEPFQILLELEKRDVLSPQELLSCKLLKVKLLHKLGNHLDAIKTAEETFQESQKQGNLLLSFDSLLNQAYEHNMMGNISQSEDVIKQAEDLFKVIKQKFTIDLKERESFLVRIKANNYKWKGDIPHSLELNKRAYELVKATGNKELISISLNNIADNYIWMKKYDKAIFYAKEAVKVNYKPVLSVLLATLIDIFISKGDIDETKVYLEQSRQLTEKIDTKYNEILYRHSKAMVLKSSLRARDRVKAEELLIELAMDKTIGAETRIKAIIDLCDLFLIELRITNDLEIIGEIQPFIQELLDIAEKQHMYLILAQTYFLEAKLSLLTVDLKKAKRFLTQAQKIAERFGYTEVAEKIADEQFKLLKQTDIWEKLKEIDAPLNERIKLARLNEQIEEIIDKRAMLPVFVSEEKVAITKEIKICLVCRGQVSRFIYICDCGAIYCEDCARAITNLENVCWACERPIDYFKSVKLNKEQVKETKIDKGKK
ncbi:MAG: hypothetical protein ACFFFT_19860 [Candidatus Thorarchaeota archaeon]